MTDVSDINEINVALALGQCIFQKPVLGKGSFGSVVRGIHKVSGIHYAIKMMVCDSDERIKYQRRELGLLTKPQLSHRNIIQYYNSWVSMIENKQILCIQMELCWLSLRDYVFKNGLYSRSFAIVKDERFYKHIFPQILNGLDAIHSVGWIHRDINPCNILIANPKPSRIQDIVIKIADFGLARRIGKVVDSSASLTVKPELDKLSPNVGNWLMRAPELSTPHYDYKVDLYSAGIVLYLLCRYVEDASQWEPEIKELIADPSSKLSDLYHKDEMLFQLLNGLLKRNPDERLSALKALDTFFPQNETDGLNVATSKSSVTFLAKKEGEDEYNRCRCTPDQSLLGIKIAVENTLIGVRREDQVLRQEYISANGEKILVNVNCDKDVKAMFESAEKDNNKVKLIVSEKPPTAMEDEAFTTELKGEL